jgi:recombination protein RecA
MSQKKKTSAADLRAKREETIASIVARTRTAYGEDSLGTLEGKHALKSHNDGAISTGSIGIDKILGGGLPRGRIIEIYGQYGGGKTTLALHVISECQKAGGIAAFIDAEHSLDPVYAAALGVNLSELLLAQPESGEQALQLLKTLVSSGDVQLVIIDSVAALVPQAELAGDIGDTHVGLQARLMSQALRILTAEVQSTNTCVVFINQLRSKIGVRFGSPETTPGGNALKFYSSVRIDIRRIGALKKGDVDIGNRVRVKVMKNKVAPPFRKCEIDLVFGVGICKGSELLDYGVVQGIINKKGAWYSLATGEKLGQGRAPVIKQLLTYPKVVDEIREKAMSDS